MADAVEELADAVKKMAREASGQGWQHTDEQRQQVEGAGGGAGGEGEPEQWAGEV